MNSIRIKNQVYIFKRLEYESNNSYFFAKGTNIWGWATWKRAWEDFDIDRFGYNGYQDLKEYYPTIFQRIRAKRYLTKAWKKETNTWDYQWEFHNLFNNNISIIPNKNLIENIGFDSGTHTNGNNYVLKKEDLDFPLILPESNEVKIDSKYFGKTLSFFSKGWIKRKLKIVVFKCAGGTTIQKEKDNGLCIK